MAGVVDVGPMVVRRGVWEHMGGLDEGMSTRGQSAMMTDWAMAFHVWMGAHKLLHMAWEGGQGMTSAGRGGTHKGGQRGLREMQKVVGRAVFERHVVDPYDARQQREVRRANMLLMPLLDVWH
ncbi:hypothetical protein CLOM_g7268 [Closterium sp. NIES-68]|nr:hypothetical protein CLOM_g7268 [Closterium sp. NIES-68]